MTMMECIPNLLSDAFGLLNRRTCWWHGHRGRLGSSGSDRVRWHLSFLDDSRGGRRQLLDEGNLCLEVFFNDRRCLLLHHMYGLMRFLNNVSMKLMNYGLVNLMDNIAMHFMNHWLMNLTHLFLVDYRLVMLMNYWLVVFMYNILMMFMNNLLVMFMNYVPMRFLNYGRVSLGYDLRSDSMRFN